MSYLDNANDQADLIIAQADFIEALAERVSALEQAAPPVDAPEPPVEEPPVEEPEPPVDEGPGETPPVVTPPVTPSPPVIATGLQAIVNALKSAKGGEVIDVTGTMGDLNLSGINPAHTVTIRGDATFQRIYVAANCSDIQFQGVKAAHPIGKTQPVVQSEGKRIVFDDMKVWGAPDADDYMAWSQKDWTDRKRAGIMLNGPDNILQGSEVLGTYMAVALKGVRSMAIGNDILGISGDGTRAIGNYTVVADNLISDFVKIDNNHDDGGQSWVTSGGVVVGVEYLRNTISAHVEPNHPLASAIQGIGFFNGPYAECRFIGNDMTVGARHGITVYAMQSGEVSGNFVRHWKGARNTSGITVRSGSPIKIADNVSDFIDAAGQTPTGTMNLDEAAGRGITNAVQLAAYLAA